MLQYVTFIQSSRYVLYMKKAKHFWHFFCWLADGSDMLMKCFLHEDPAIRFTNGLSGKCYFQVGEYFPPQSLKVCHNFYQH
jgi:hypothetical protein